MAFLVNPYVHGAGTVSGYLLDTYSATVAYSLRQLKTGVTNVVRVRRSPGNQERDFTATEVTDGTLASFIGSGKDGFVVTWYDQSGNANDITQSTASNQPQLVSSGAVLNKGSLPAIQFDGSNDYLDKSPAFINSTDISSFSVSHSSSTGNVGTVLALAINTTSTLRIFQDSRTTPNRNLVINTPTLYAADLSTDRVDTNQRLLSSFIDSSKNMSAFDNGATGGTNTYVGTFANNGLMVGRQQTTTYLNGGVQEIILFNTDESSNRTAIESDINTYYSIY
jgi:hypothetical protein